MSVREKNITLIICTCKDRILYKLITWSLALTISLFNFQGNSPIKDSGHAVEIGSACSVDSPSCHKIP